MRVTLHGNKRRQTLIIGNKAPATRSEPTYFARIEDNPTVFTVAAEPFDELRKAQEALRERSFMSFEPSTLTAIENAVRKFFAATTVDELAATVRGGDITAARMRDYYRDRPIHPAGLREVAVDGNVQATGALRSVVVLLDDFSARAIAFEEVDGRFVVDWESWVAWGEMEWADLIEKRPSDPVLLRVKCSQVDYYNFDFSDDRRWTSFLLQSGDGKSSLYGYVPRLSTLEHQLTPRPGADRGQAMIVRIRYPEEATRGDQVIIDSLVTSGWVLPGE